MTQRLERPLGQELPAGGLRLVFADPTGRGLALCSSAGLLAVDIDATPGSPSASLRTLDPAPCGWMTFIDKRLLLPDGRVLVATSVYPGGDTRLVVVDEDRAQAVLLLRTDSPINDATNAWERRAGPWDHRVLLEVSSPNGAQSLAVLRVPPR